MKQLKVSEEGAIYGQPLKLTSASHAWHQIFGAWDVH